MSLCWLWFFNDLTVSLWGLWRQLWCFHMCDNYVVQTFDEVFEAYCSCTLYLFLGMFHPSYLLHWLHDPYTLRGFWGLSRALTIQNKFLLAICYIMGEKPIHRYASIWGMKQKPKVHVWWSRLLALIWTSLCMWMLWMIRSQ